MSQKIVQPRRSARGNNRLSLPAELPRDNLDTADFKVSFKKIQLPKEMITNDSLLGSLQDSQNSKRMALTRSHVQKIPKPDIHGSSVTTDEIVISENVIKMESRTSDIELITDEKVFDQKAIISVNGIHGHCEDSNIKTESHEHAAKASVITDGATSLNVEDRPTDGTDKTYNDESTCPTNEMAHKNSDHSEKTEQSSEHTQNSTPTREQSKEVKVMEISKTGAAHLSRKNMDKELQQNNRRSRRLSLPNTKSDMKSLNQRTRNNRRFSTSKDKSDEKTDGPIHSEYATPHPRNQVPEKSIKSITENFTSDKENGVPLIVNEVKLDDQNNHNGHKFSSSMKSDISKEMPIINVPSTDLIYDSKNMKLQSTVEIVSNGTAKSDKMNATNTRVTRRSLGNQASLIMNDEIKTVSNTSKIPKEASRDTSHEIVMTDIKSNPHNEITHPKDLEIESMEVDNDVSPNNEDMDDEKMEVNNAAAVATTEMSNNDKNGFNNNDHKNMDEMELENLLQQNPYSKYHGYSVDNSKDEYKPESDNDSALGSLVSEEKYEEDRYKEFPKGVIIWAGYTPFNWYPSMVWDQKQIIPTVPNVKNSIFVKYFNYAGVGGSVKLCNVFPFTSVEAFWKEITEVRKTKKSKIKKFTPRVLRAIEEAKIFLEFDVDLRIRIYNEIVRLQTGPTHKRVIEKDVYDDSNDVPEDLRPFIQKYIENLKTYDDNEEARELVGKRVRSPKAARKDFKDIKLGGGWMGSVANQLQQTSHITSRQSTRISEKRRFSVVSLSSNESTSVTCEETPQPVPKKRRLSASAADKVPLEEKFKFQPKDILALFKNASTQNVCMECFEPDDVHQCIGCPYYFHQNCSHHSDVSVTTIRHQTGDSDTIIENKIVTLTCKSCATALKSCFMCKNAIDGVDKYVCNSGDCKRIFHKSCLEKCSQSKYNKPGLKNICPHHDCHTCLSKNINRIGAVVKCVKCPATYHPDIYCLPAGTKVLSKTLVICPRHKSPKEKVAPLNSDYCWVCQNHGNLICCDSCPMAAHRECLPEGTDPDQESYICDDCENGTMPLYNTIVWAKVGVYRWWPAFVLTPQASKSKESSKVYQRQFCVRFFGSYDYYWVTSDRVYSFSYHGPATKSGNKRLDVSFSNAINEANEMISKLDGMRDDQIKSKPMSYRMIEKNQPIPPVKLVRLKKDQKHEICGCDPLGPSPCSIDSECINRTLKIECDESCLAKTRCQNKKLQNREYADIKIKSVGNRGFGAFAGNDIPAGSLVIEYVGELINKAEFMRRISSKRARGDKDYYFMGIDGDLIIDAEPAGNKSRFLNHSCTPNCTTEKVNVDGNTRMAIIANQFIPKGTELTFNYQFDYLEHDAMKLRCYCGTSRCTGFIGVEVKKEESEENRKIIKVKRQKKNSKQMNAVTSKTPLKSHLELTELDPMIPMIMSLACESDESALVS